MAISMAELAKQLLTAKQPERYSEVMDRGPYSTGEPINIGYGAGDQMSPLDAAALITSPVPVVGDVTGLAADVDMYMRDPESRNIPNYILSAAGVVPFVPAASQVRKGIKAFHGSPHSFDRFSTESIGTGEGAQQYGRGLYFAENEKVAKEYREQLSRNQKVEIEINGTAVDYDGKSDTKNIALDLIAGEVRKFPEKSVSEAIDDALKQSKTFSEYDDPKIWEPVQEWINKNRSSITSVKPRGSMYEVNIDVEPDELLKWDRPIDEQPQGVKGFVEKYKKGDEGDLPLKERVGMPYDPTDEQLMHRLTRSPQGVRELLKRGVKGVKYADAFTRHKSPDKQSINYVIFDDRLISIAKKYGVAIPVAAAMLARATGEDTSQSFQEET